MSDAPRLVTCGLPYTNGSCHLGHLRTYVPADMYVRYRRHRGEEITFVCGSDNHGTPIVVSAEAEGVSPAELSRRYHEHFDRTFRRMNVTFDHFGMTDGETNHRRTRAIVERLQENGHVYAERIEQSYCPSCRRFLPDRYSRGSAPTAVPKPAATSATRAAASTSNPARSGSRSVPGLRHAGRLREQEHFFFRLSTFGPFLLEHLKHLRGTANARNYALGWVRDGLRDWCITRTLEWGVRYPGRDDLVVYVWVDAPIGYIAFTEEWAAAHGKDWRQYWCGGGEITHFIGGDITYHHCLYWPALLKGAGYGLPSAVVASGMLKVDDHKFSKSRGMRRLDERGLSRPGAPCRLPPLLPRCLHEPHTRAELLLAGLRRKDQQRACQHLRQLRPPDPPLRPHAVRRGPRGGGERARLGRDRGDPRRSRRGHDRVRVQERGRRGDGAGGPRQQPDPGERPVEAGEDRSCGGRAGDRGRAPAREGPITPYRPRDARRRTADLVHARAARRGRRQPSR